MHIELIDQRREHEDKYARAFEEARVSLYFAGGILEKELKNQNLAVEEHSQDLILLREELTATHTQLIADHRAKVEHLKAVEAGKIRDQQEAHQGSIDELQNEAARVAEKALSDLNAVREVVGLTQLTLEKAEEENRELMAKLEEAVTNSVDPASEDKLKEAQRRISELQDELEDTKTVSYTVTSLIP